MYLEKNKEALELLAKFYPTKNLPQAYSDDPRSFGSDLRVAGVVCSSCGKSITGRNLQFCGFSPTVKCFICQNK